MRKAVSILSGRLGRGIFSGRNMSGMFLTTGSHEHQLWGRQSSGDNEGRLCLESLDKLRVAFYEDPKNVLAQNVCSRIDPFEACLSRRTIESTQHVFNYKVEPEGKPLTHQKSSGRCWIFAALNAIRLPFMKQFNLEEFEFSQGYVFFWDKIERAHYWLQSIVDVCRRGENLDGRLMAFLLQNPVGDGGQWDMVVSLVEKYGVMPKKCFPETFSCESSRQMNLILKSKLREYAKALREKVLSGASHNEVQSLITEQMTVIYHIVAVCLSIPPTEFTWEYYNKNKAFCSLGPISPKQFYEEHVKPVFNVSEKVCLVSDPRPGNPFGRLYSVDCLGNVVGGQRTLYNNQPIETLLKSATQSIKAGEGVWFGCEVSKRFAGKLGLEDLDIHDFNLLFNTDVQISMNKADRLLYGDSSMTHAMIFTGVSTDSAGEARKFRVENSWGEERGERGHLLLTSQWFKEFVFEVVCDRKFVPTEVLAVFSQEPCVLPAWDPMGTLANYI